MLISNLNSNGGFEMAQIINYVFPEEKEGLEIMPSSIMINKDFCDLFIL